MCVIVKYTHTHTSPNYVAIKNVWCVLYLLRVLVLVLGSHCTRGRLQRLIMAGFESVELGAAKPKVV